MERVRSERDTHFVQEEQLFAHMRLLSMKLKTGSPEWSAKRNKYYAKNPQKQLIEPIEVQEAMDKQFQTRWRQTEAKLRDMSESNSAQVQILAASLRESELEHQQLHTANERRLQLEAQAL